MASNIVGTQTMQTQNIKQMLYDRLAEQAPGFEEYLSFLIETVEAIDLSGKETILDIGTGWGIMAICVAMYGPRVITGQPKDDDFSHFHDQEEEHDCDHQGTADELHEHHNHEDFNWEQNVEAVGLQDRISFEYMDVENLHYGDAMVDAIFMFDTLHHVSNREKAMAECIRVLKPDGVLCVIEHNNDGVLDTKQRWGIEIEQVDPRKYLPQPNVFQVEYIKGVFLNAFVMRKL